MLQKVAIKMKLIKFGAVWCPACLVMSSKINKLIEKYNLELINYDYDLDTEQIKKYNVGKVLPELILLDDNNNEINRLIGEHSLKKLEEFIDK